MTDSPNRECAIRLAAAGLAVFPCDPKKRTPLFKGWQTLSSNDAVTVTGWGTRWPGAAPALDLAKCGLLVLDGDRHHPDVDGVAALRQLLKGYGVPVAALPMVRTPRDGVHVYFRQPEPPLSNAVEGLPPGIDVRGNGYVIAPGAMLANRRRYVPIVGQPELAAAFVAQTIPVVPAAIVALLKPVRRQSKKTQPSNGTAGARERAYAKGALRRIASDLADAPAGTRNNALNKAAFVLGTMVARGWISAQEVEDALTVAMERNGYAADKGSKAIDATLASGLQAGIDNPHDDLPEQGIRLEDFVSHAPSRTYFFLPCREPWPGASVNTRLPKVEVTTADGELKDVSPSAWLDLHRSVEQMTWCPGEPMLIPDKLFVAAGGWVERQGVTSLNHYRAPLIEPGNAADAERWVHVHKVYPDSAEHIIRWLAHRVQRPAEKINHAVVLGGPQGIGKDTLLEPAKYAVGPWNVCEISPTALLGRFNGFLKSVILRVSEVHDLGEFNRFALYERLKAYTAAPPDGLRVDEKHLREYTIVNCCGVVITSNHQDALFLPADDRRHYVAWSELTKDSFVVDYWRRLWGWYDAGGLNHVAAYLRELDLAGLDPKAPPPKTPAFWQIVSTGSAPEDAELADLLDKLGNPDAVTLAQLRAKADANFDEWLSDRRNRRVIPHRMSSCGYVPVRNPDTEDGLWRIQGVRQAIYTKAALSHEERFQAARELTQ